MIWHRMCLSSVIGSTAARSMASMVSCILATTLTLGLAAKSANSDVITLPRISLSHLQSYLSLARFILNFYVSCGCWLTCRRSSTSISLGTKRILGVSVSGGVGLAHLAIIGCDWPCRCIRFSHPHSFVGSWHCSPHECRFCSPLICG